MRYWNMRGREGMSEEVWMVASRRSITGCGLSGLSIRERMALPILEICVWTISERMSKPMALVAVKPFCSNRVTIDLRSIIAAKGVEILSRTRCGPDEESGAAADSTSSKCEGKGVDGVESDVEREVDVDGEVIVDAVDVEGVVDDEDNDADDVVEREDEVEG